MDRDEPYAKKPEIRHREGKRSRPEIGVLKAVIQMALPQLYWDDETRNAMPGASAIGNVREPHGDRDARARYTPALLSAPPGPGSSDDRPAPYSRGSPAPVTSPRAFPGTSNHPLPRVAVRAPGKRSEGFTDFALEST